MRCSGMLACLLMTALSATGCGQKGPLYREMPPETPAQAEPAPHDRADDTRQQDD